MGWVVGPGGSGSWEGRAVRDDREARGGMTEGVGLVEDDRGGRAHGDDREGRARGDDREGRARGDDRGGRACGDDREGRARGDDREGRARGRVRL